MAAIKTTIETEVTVEVEVYCAQCGNDLYQSVHVKDRSTPEIHVYPCPDCMQKKEDEIEELKEKVRELESKIE
jgi:Zn finger protein HypA/HybF involved in hydrogenase expression